MPDRSKVRFQTKRDTGRFPCSDGQSALPGCVYSSDVPVQANQLRRKTEEDPTSLIKAKLESAHQEEPEIGPTVPGLREPFKQYTVDLAPGAIEGAGGVFSK